MLVVFNAVALFVIASLFVLRMIFLIKGKVVRAYFINELIESLALGFAMGLAVNLVINLVINLATTDWHSICFTLYTCGTLLFEYVSCLDMEQDYFEDLPEDKEENIDIK